MIHLKFEVIIIHGPIFNYFHMWNNISKHQYFNGNTVDTDLDLSFQNNRSIKNTQ